MKPGLNTERAIAGVGGGGWLSLGSSGLQHRYWIWHPLQIFGFFFLLNPTNE
jgi:hypothetical protein